MDLSVVIPMFNEAENVEGTLGRIHEALLAFKGSYEIIPVNDGSTDNTLDVLRGIAAQDKKSSCLVSEEFWSRKSTPNRFQSRRRRNHCFYRCRSQL